MSGRKDLATVEEKCETCRFWVQGDPGYDEDQYHGECRRRSPVRILQDAPDVLKHWCGDEAERIEAEMEYAPLRRVFPVTVQRDWCGEYQPTPVPPPDSQ